jgi:hypothetical protein
MFGFEKVDLTFAFSVLFFILGVLLIIGYAVYTYLYTVPQISSLKKSLLVLLRTSALLLLLFILFEPVLTLAKKESFPPVNLVYIDNSRSIKIEDGTGREEDVRSFLSALKSSGTSENSVLHVFGNKVKRSDSISPAFNEGITNFSEIFTNVEESNLNISSITVVSDGVITEGSNPVYKASRMNIPVYTVGIGDSTRKNDIMIRDVLYNEYIYAGITTVISASVLNKGYSGESVSVSLSEGGRTVGQQNITLTNDGLQEAAFDYKPETPGEKKLTLSVSNLKGEQSYDNNKSVFFINVLSSKIKVLLLAGAPSADLSFVRNALQQDENLTVNSITQIAPGRYLENNNRENLIDSAEIIFLIGFPSKETDNTLLNKVVNEISAERKPFFLVLSDGIDYNKLRSLQNELPFVINNTAPGYTEVIPDIDQGKIRHPLLQTGSDKVSMDWGGLPPVNMSNADFTAKAESEVLAKIKIKNIPVPKPLILTRKLGSKKSAAILAKDIWRWKLQTAVKESRVFESFMLNSVKWLNTRDDQKQVVVRTSKKIYSQGEEVRFTGQVYDASFNPLPDARLTVNISTGEETNNIILNPIGNGIYEGIFETNKTGDYKFTGNAELNGDKIGSDNGAFNIGEVDIEMLNPRMDYEFLSLLANETNGKFFLPEEQEELFRLINQRIDRTTDVKIITSEFSLWANEWLMVIVIFLFAAEWFIRKQSGML